MVKVDLRYRTNTDVWLELSDIDYALAERISKKMLEQGMSVEARWRGMRLWSGADYFFRRTSTPPPTRPL